ISLDIERIVGGSGNDFITGSDADNSLDGRAGNDTIFGGLGNDSIDGSGGNDSLAGESGNDVLTGGSGQDSMTGGGGDDSFISNDGEADTLDGGNGNDTAVADQPGDSFTSIESGINVPAPEITVTVGSTTLTDNFSTVDFGTVGQGQTGSTRTFTVRNDGDDVLSVGAVTVPAGFTIIDPLVGPIAAGSSESFTVQVDTSVAGAKSGTISFANSDADENPFNIAVTATVNPAPPQIPDISVKLGGADIADNTTAAVDFGSVNQNAAGPTRTFTVFNDGTGPLTIGSLSVPAGFTVIDPLVGPIAAGGSESFTVRLDTGTAGVKAGDVVITSNDPDEDPFNFAISGTVVAVVLPSPDISVTMARPAGPVDNGNTTIEFGNKVVGSRGATRTFRVANVGNAALDLGAVSVPAGFTLVDPLVTSIPVGGIATFTVRLDTVSPGTKNGFVSIPSNDPDENPFTFRVVGSIGVENKPLPEITINAMQRGQLRGVDDGASAFSFGVVAPNSKFVRSARTFRVANDGDATLTFGKMSVPAGFVVLDGLPASLEPGQTDTLVIAVDSTSKAGNKAGQISFATNDTNENPFSFSLSATVGTVAPTGGKPEISVFTTSGQAIVDGSTSAISFGSVQRDGKTPTRTFRVRNDGSGTLTVGSVSVPSGFIVMDPLVGPIAAGASESFTIGLSTGSAGNRSGQVTFSTNDANESPFNFGISGAVSAPPASGPAVTAALSGGTLTVNGTSGLDTIALTSSGGGVSVIGNGTAVSGSPFNGVRRIVVHGFDGDDRIDGSGVSIPLSLFGGNGNDALIGGFGVDDLHGEGGNDTLTATDGVADAVIDGGAGTDTIRKDRVDPSSGT
ncbi:MAG: choice-of-anchor domain, partial [Phycisphaerales bacterium]|nr:choice-of-anchor domain [Phycisphaerales bacterium]